MKKFDRAIIILGLLSFLGCATAKVQLPPGKAAPAEYLTFLEANETWRALMRFASSNGYHFLKLESEQGIMEISTDDVYSNDYASYYVHYNFVVVGLAKGTKIVVDTSFFDSNGREVKIRNILERIKKEKDSQILLEIKNFFENGKGRL